MSFVLPRTPEELMNLGQKATRFRFRSNVLRGALGGDTHGRRVVEQDEVRRTERAKVVNHRDLVLRTGQQRLPAREVLAAVEVSGRDPGEPRCGDPAEEGVPVEELEAVDERGELGPRAECAGGARRA